MPVIAALLAALSLLAPLGLSFLSFLQNGKKTEVVLETFLKNLPLIVGSFEEKFMEDKTASERKLIVQNFEALQQQSIDVYNKLLNLEETIRWEPATLHYSKIADTINLGIKYQKEIIDSSAKENFERKKLFEEKLLSLADNENIAEAVNQLLNGLSGTIDHGFSGSILEAFYRKTGGNCGQMIAFSNNMLQLLAHGTLLVQVVDTIKNGKVATLSIPDFYRDQWLAAWKNIQESIDQCKTHVNENMQADMEFELTTSAGKTAKEIAVSLKNRFLEKYDWIEFQVNVYRKSSDVKMCTYSGSFAQKCFANDWCAVAFYHNKPDGILYAAETTNVIDVIIKQRSSFFNTIDCKMAEDSIKAHMKAKNIGWWGIFCLKAYQKSGTEFSSLHYFTTAFAKDPEPSCSSRIYVLLK